MCARRALLELYKETKPWKILRLTSTANDSSANSMADKDAEVEQIKRKPKVRENLFDLRFEISHFIASGRGRLLLTAEWTKENVRYHIVKVKP